VHIDGMREVHDQAVDREGVFDRATAHMREAIDRGYRVCTNTTIYRGVPAEEYVDLFTFLTEMGVEGCITSPGFDYEAVTHDREQFLARKEAQALYSEVHRRCEGMDVPFYNNQLFHEFLEGKREYRCSAWSRTPAQDGGGRGAVRRTGSRGGGAPAICSPTATWPAWRSSTRGPTGRRTARTATRGAPTA